MKPSVRRGLSARKLARLDALLAAEGLAPAAAVIPRRPAGASFALSAGEEQLWLLARLAPADPAYNMPFVLRLRGRLAPGALEAGLAALAGRHEILRTVFPALSGRPVRRIEGAPSPALPVVDLRHLPAPAADAEAARLAAEEAGRPFDLEHGPLLRTTLLALAPEEPPEEHRLLLSLHHIVADGASLAVLLRELPLLAQGLALPELPLQTADFAAWQREWLAGEEAAAHRAWWRERLAGLPPQELPADRAAPAVPTSRGGFVPFFVDAGRTAALRRIGREERATLFTVLLAACTTALHRWSGQTDVAVGSPVAGRSRPELAGLIGFFVNMVVLRTDLDGDPVFRELLARARETALAAFEHGDLPFEVLVEELSPERRAGRTPFFRAALVLGEPEPPGTAAVTAPELRWELAETLAATAKFDLELELREGPDGLAGRLWFARDLFDAPTAERLAGHLGELLAGIGAGIDGSPERRISELPLLTAAERRQLAVWADNCRPYPVGRGIHQLFAEQVARAPEATALVYAGGRISYRELDRLSDGIADRLAACGLGAETRVGLFAERSPAMIAATLGILKAGSAYVPLDPGYPRERLDWMLADAGLAAVLAERSLIDRLPTGPGAPRPLLLDEALATRETEAAAKPGGAWAGPESAAYVMYTSGSTGRPKGVVITHRNVVRLVRGADFADFDAGHVFLQLAPVSFDAATLEIWGALLNGGTLVVPEPGALSLDELARQIRDHGVTTLWLTAGLFHRMIDERLDALAGVRQLLAGGDVLSPAHVARAFDGLPGTRLVNGYGPTENTTFTCCHTVSGRPDGPVPLGRSIANTWIHVVDRALGAVAVGVAGELCAGGDGLARGYLGRPGLTAERFVPDPFAAQPGARLYRTGDLVRRRPDGAVEFLGRLDSQVKIRGFRVEPGEVEQTLGLHPGVASCAVAVRDDRTGDKRLVAYVVAAPAVADAELRAFLERTLPAAMIPTAFVRLAALPLNPNGKIDRRALPAPVESAAGETGTTASRTPAEELLAGIWMDVLGVARVEVGDDFFSLGGHSLAMMQVASRVRDTFGVELPLRTFFEEATLGALAARFADGGPDRLPPLRPASRSTRPDRLPLSFAQSRLWFLDQLEPGQPTYNIPLVVALRGPLDSGALEAAFRCLVDRHESLRTGFPAVAGEPVQAIAGGGAGFTLPRVDLAALPEPLRTATAARLEAAAAGAPFDLARGPLLRALLLRAGAAGHTLVLVIHHIVADGWSLEVLWRELGIAYAACLRREPPALPVLPVQAADAALWQRGWLCGELLESQVAWWRPRLEGIPVLEIAADHPRPAVRSRRGAGRSRPLSPQCLAALRDVSRRQGATLFMTVLASLQALLHRYTGQADLAVGSPVANRGLSEIEGLIGFFVNTLVFRASVDGGAGFSELLAAVREAALGAYAHQDVPFELLVQELQPERDLHHAPLFQVMLNLESRGEGPRLAGLTTAARVLATGRVKLDLGFSVVDGDAPAAEIEYASELFEAATIERMLGHWLSLAQAAAASPASRIEELPLLSPEERRQIAEWNATGRDYPGEECLHELIAAQAARTPDAVAVTFEGEALSYRELDLRAGRLAARLRRLGVAPGALVGICAERSLELVVGLLGILQAGAAYVPIDPGYPAERQAYMLADSAVSVLLTQSALNARRPETQARDETIEPAAAPRVPADSLAYMIYTSGSTGRPKGAMNSHRAVRNRLLWMQEAFGLSAGDRVLQKTPFSFDVSVWEFFWPLLVGARLVVAKPGGHQDPDYLADLIVREGITTLHFVPSMLRAFLEVDPETRGGDRCSSLRRVVCSGEALPADLEQLFWARSGAELHNLYGPTEAAVDVTWWPCERGSRAAAVPIGRPIANTAVRLLDRRLRPVPAGVPGELCIGGVQPARGYWRRAGLTAERFIPDAWGEPGSRLYKTGDLCRWRPDGAVEYLGRIDHQVKIRGLRVELGEIEAALREHPDVREAAVALHGTGSGAALVAYLVAYPVPATVLPAPAELRRFLLQRLPEALIPAVFQEIAELPLSPSGKVDRKALPEPDAPRGGGVGDPGPRSPLAEIVAAVWAEVLGVDDVGAADDFFALGGHSLKATQVVSRLRAALGIELPLRALFEAPTPAALAARLETILLRREELPEALPVPPRADRGAPLPLSFSQQRLWFLDRLEPGNPAYTIPALVRWEGPLEAPLLERSLAAILERHEALRTTFDAVDGEPVQVIGPAPACRLATADLSGLPRERREREVEELATAMARRPFDLARGPLVRFHLFRLGERDHRLLVVFHHIVADWWSLGVFLRELGAAEEPLPPLPVQYADFALWQRRWLSGARLEAQLDHWRRSLAGVPQLDLPADRPRPAQRTFRGASRPFVLPAALSARLGTVARGAGVTRFMVLLAAFQALLQRLSGQTDFAVGTPIANRNQPWIEGLIGFFVNTLALRADLAGSPAFRELLRRVREVSLGAYAHQDVPFERLVEELVPRRDLSHPPLFQVLLTFQNEVPARDLPGRTLRLQGLALDTAKFDLTLALGDGPGGLEGYVEHNADLFDAVTAERLAGCFRRLLAAALASPEERVEELEILDDAEKRQLLVEWNDTRAPEPAACVHERFAAWAVRRPAAPALVREEQRWTYAELAGRVDRLAGHLRSLGVGPESRVGLCLERSAEAVLALLAVLAAGGAYVPLDPSHPRERLAGSMADAGVSAVVTLEALLARLPEMAATVVCLDRDAAEIAAASPEVSGGGGPPDLDHLDHLAYVLFTSGSTGRPKGVAIGHRQLAGYVDGVLARLGLPEGSSFATVSTLSADLGNTALFPALCTGGCLHVVSERRATDPVLFAEYFRRERIDCLKIVPSHLAALLSGPDPAGILPVRRLVLGGEASSWELIAGLRALAPELGILNHYGPTETTVGVLTWPVGGRLDGVGTTTGIPLGRPLPNVRTYVLGPRCELLPAGVPGELCIGGGSLARGYLARPGLTAERFVPDPFAVRPGARMYRTGDRVRCLPGGAVEFLGRIDLQVKIRGFRVEPGEVEAALKRCAGVREAVVAAAAGGGELVAWLAADRSLGTADLRERLRGELPPHMIPAAFVVLDALPLTPNGKLDRRALPAPGTPRAEEAAPEVLALGSNTARQIAAVWRDVLGVDRVGLHDNFFDLGGHSLLLIRVQGRLRAALGREIPVVDLFRFPTVAALAGHLGGEADSRAVAGPRSLGGGHGDIAVIGLSGRFPGAASARELWDNLCRGVEGITFFGAASPGDAPGQRHVPARGVLADAGLFDAGFFGIRPREAELLDPQHRLFLECAWEAVESAGYDPGRYGGAIGVWAGVGKSWYYLSRIHGGPGAEEPEAHFGNDKDFLPTRVSYKLGLRGPSLSVQTSCSSSLVAVHLACRSLAAGECDMALAGGARVVVPQEQGYVYEEGGIASPDGHCRAFDAEAGGVVPGNGVGVVLLKRLADALADGDPVLAVIKGSAVNNDGSGKIGYTAPGVDGQARVIAAAHAAAGVSADSISYVEAHGTGTALGDPIEVAALKQAFAGAGGRGVCALGSIKTNIGHLDAAAGVAGLIKTVLALHHRQIPPTLHFRRPNPELGLEESPFFVNASLLPWDSAGPRRAGVSSFGIGGTNAHVVLEEAPPLPPADPPSRPWQLLTVSARSEIALEQAATALNGHLEGLGEHVAEDVADIAWTLHAGRRAFSWRRALIAGSDGSGATLAAAEPAVAFLFPGQGAQRAGMARDLYLREAVFRAEIDRAAGLLHPLLGVDLRELLAPPAGGEAAAGHLLERTELTQPALFAMEHALARLWMAWGVRPAAMLGHSVGEYVAACLAGVFSVEDALRLVAERGRLIGELPPGAMLAVPLSAAGVGARLSSGVFPAAVAAVNSAASCVVSGETAAVEAFHGSLLAEGIEGKRLRVSHAFHSAMMDPVLDRFTAAVAAVERRPPSLPWVSNVSGTWIGADEAVDPAYWARHLRQTVRFDDALTTLAAEPNLVLLEVGPGETLGRFARRHAGCGERPVIASLPQRRDGGGDQRSALEALGRLWEAGVEPDWEAFHAGERRRRVALPTYPFERKRYWIEGIEAPDRPAAGRKVDLPAWETALDALAAAAADPGQPVVVVAGALAPEAEEALARTGARVIVLGAAPSGPEERRNARPPADAPRGEIESAIAAIWRELFGLQRIGVHDGFYALGGDSLLATQIVARMRAALGREITLSAFLEAGTIARLAALCDSVPAAPPVADAGALLAHLESLSTEELEALLVSQAADHANNDSSLEGSEG
ncbi:MAG TPA: amino acid adenylation domain-containing protein [Thermoanaerobaculia bacterium]|nr:amino acid adenylation domain-containing protein [Thermoanaerobaculia bacterium]